MQPLKKNTKIGFQDQLSLNAGQKHCRMLQGEHSAILPTFMKRPFSITTFVLYIFEWTLKTGFTIPGFYTWAINFLINKKEEIGEKTFFLSFCLIRRTKL